MEKSITILNKNGNKIVILTVQEFKALVDVTNIWFFDEKKGYDWGDYNCVDELCREISIKNQIIDMIDEAEDTALDMGKESYNSAYDLRSLKRKFEELADSQIEEICQLLFQKYKLDDRIRPSKVEDMLDVKESCNALFQEELKLKEINIADRIMNE
ncbi:hypothetical protein EDC18_102391 [Natranaerovirga pectinivora]|uniref:Uncharacterized protein n=1 Tax=Natranaerovirga pectinivora TaxID=682400 RepID=A0A4R3MPB1_9FIRM|nr:hypothetical protein [Natranaerovirga pectinivora]TCT16372.1 hypothetical protein EDC18_102391 [Natranaerovirga pectinivora]